MFEWNPPGVLKHLPGTGGGDGSKMDLALSRQGIALGRALAEGTLRPSQVGDWLRETLGTQGGSVLAVGPCVAWAQPHLLSLWLARHVWRRIHADVRLRGRDSSAQADDRL